MVVEYFYAEGNLIEKPHNYQYSEYYGMPLLLSWLQQRKAVKAELGQPEPPPKSSGSYPFKIEKIISSELLFDNIFQGLASNKHKSDNELKKYLKLLLKSFELTKRVYSEYDGQLKPVDKDTYKNIGHYLRLAELMVVAYKIDRDLTYLNALLKLVDILIAHRAELDYEFNSRLSWVIEKEIMHVVQKAKQCGVDL